MKRPSDQKPRPTLPLPDELHPIVDSVVDVVFERLRGAAMGRKGDVKEPLRGAPMKLNLPLPKQRKALAEALADLLLADLARRTAKKSAKKIAKKNVAKPKKAAKKSVAKPAKKGTKKKTSKAPRARR